MIAKHAKQSQPKRQNGCECLDSYGCIEAMTTEKRRGLLGCRAGGDVGNDSAQVQASSNKTLKATKILQTL